MPRTRLLLVEVPPLLGDIVSKRMAVSAVLRTQPDFEVVEIGDRGALPEAASKSKPDVVLLALGERELPAACVEWFRAHPEVRVLALASEGRDLTEFRCVRNDVSMKELLNAIREVSRSPHDGLDNDKLHARDGHA